MEAAIRLGTFLAIFAVVALAEWRFPKRDRLRPRQRALAHQYRHPGVRRDCPKADGRRCRLPDRNLRTRAWLGLFNWLGWPSWIEGLLAFLMLDFAIYLQHVMSHALPLFWRLHQVHHADLDVDLTTGIRFHPLEIIISSIYKAAVVAALGIDPWIVILFEAVLNASAVYTHGNVRLPHRLDASAALGVLHAGHASYPPLDDPAGDQLQFRLLPVRVGPRLRHHAAGRRRRVS